jgi:hypothetical protein
MNTSADAASQPAADFSCAICFDTAKEPVVTKCGHLYCWSCLDVWLQRGEPQCPICKGRISAEHAGDIIPLYGKGVGAGSAKASGASTRPRAANTSSTSDGSSGSAGATAPQAARPAANREAPPRAGLGLHGAHLGGRGSWAGGAFFFLASPSMFSWPVMLLLIAGALIYKFAPWRALLGWEGHAHQAEAAAATPRRQQHNQGTDFTLIATVIALFSFVVWVADLVV